ncbi:MAG: metallophosphoesterase [Candidatus Woesearchaeota archaeon]
MEILDDVIAEDLFIYLKESKVFILSDIHIGYEESLNKQGIFVPRNNYIDLQVRVERALEKISKDYVIKRIVLNGDIFHEFGTLSRYVKEQTKKFISLLSGYAEVTFVEGNHDKALKYLLAKSISDKNDIIVERLVLGKILVLHGDKLPSKDLLKNISTIIIGHEHPAVNISSGSRIEKYKCFLKGKYAGKNLIVIPSCNLFIEGTDVGKEKLLSPFLKGNTILDFEVYVVEDTVYDFGKLRNIVNQE